MGSEGEVGSARVRFQAVAGDALTERGLGPPQLRAGLQNTHSVGLQSTGQDRVWEVKWC